MQEERLISLPEAAALLQPLMRGRDAALWLENDARCFPLIPSALHNGQRYYVLSDVAAFAARYFGHATSRADIQRGARFGQRRERDRRRGGDRRVNAPIILAAGVERRRAPESDRRVARADRRRTSIAESAPRPIRLARG